MSPPLSGASRAPLLRRAACVTALVAAPVVALGAPVASSAQTLTAVSTQGWIGVQMDLRTSLGPDGRRTVAVVHEVSAEGPAWRAGLRPGDVVLSMNGEQPDLAFLEMARAIRPGDGVRMVIQRDGRSTDVRVVATERPGSSVVTATAYRIETDAVADSMFRRMDSLRVRLEGPDGPHLLRRVAGSSGGTTVLRRVDGTEEERGRFRELIVRLGAPFGAGGDVSAVELDEGTEMRPPFGFFLFRGERHDSLQAEMDRLNEELRRAGQWEARLLRAADGSGRPASDAVRGDLERARRERAELLARSTELRRAMERAAVTAVRADAQTVRWTAADGEVEVVGLRPLAPYVLGQNRAAGAEIVDLRPEMAAYFQVDRGVLVVDVPEGTPAARAGIVPGDVVVRIGGRTVASVAEFRENLARARLPVNVALVRRGRTLEVLLR